VGEQVHGGAAEQCRSRDRPELVADVGQRGLQPEGHEHDAGDHRVVQVGPRVSGQRVLVTTRWRRGQSLGGDDGHRVEVGPPHRREDGHSDDGGDHHAGGDAAFGPDPDRHDRLAEGDDDEQAVALGEVLRHELPSADAGEERHSDVDE
jgi:hypothetical protein